MAIKVEKLFIHVEDVKSTINLAKGWAKIFLPQYLHTGCETQAAFLEKLDEIVKDKKSVHLFVLLDNQFPENGEAGCECANMGIATARKIREIVRKNPHIKAILVSSSSQGDENFRTTGLFDEIWGKPLNRQKFEEFSKTLDGLFPKD
jgi:CheY-like chemotaxis protein